MDSAQYTNLLEALTHVPDPRKARGKQHEWRIVLIVLAVLCCYVQQWLVDNIPNRGKG